MDNNPVHSDEFISMNVICWTVLILFIIFFLCLAILLIIRKWVLFQPSKDARWDPAQQEGHRDLYLKVGDEDHNGGMGYTKKQIDEIKRSKIITFTELQYINVWLFEMFPGKRIVLYFHGNNDNISYRQYSVDICKRLGLNLLLVDYRGYGESSGFPETKSILEDAKTAYTFLKKRGYYSSEIIIWGESLGGIPAIWTAAKFKCSHLILLSTFYNLKIVINGSSIPDSFKGVVEKLFKDEYTRNDHHIKKIRCGLTVIHSITDDILPYKNAEMIHDKAGTKNGGKKIKKNLITISGIHSKPNFEDKQLKELMNGLNVKVNNESNIIKELQEIIDNLSF